MNDKKKIVIIGAGITGLAVAVQLQQKGLDFTLLEADQQPGGSMVTAHKDGYLIDYGPNSGLETTPLIRELANAAGIGGQMVYANEESNKRYILKNAQLLALPTSPPAFITSKLFSLSAKVRLLKEPFVGKSEDGYYQSIADFVKRRLGQEFLDYAIDPFVSGVFAGDPYKLSVQSAFPRLYRLEEIYGGLIKGMIKGARERKKNPEKSKQSAKMFSFKSGMQSFPAALAAVIGDKLLLNALVTKIDRMKEGYEISYRIDGEEKKIEADIIISTVPSREAAELFGRFSSDLSNHLNEIFYPEVMVLFLGYDESHIQQPLDGFGFLIPGKERRSFLGAIWSSVIFPERAPDNKAAFTLFVGGAKKEGLFEEGEEKVIRKAIEEFQEIMGITGNPEFVDSRLWERAIPQYNLGHIEHIRSIEEFEKENSSILLGGNYRGGISVGDCVKSSALLVDKVLNML
jgi:oxygen-dependent protoporphyrinogen oxidase